MELAGFAVRIPEGREVADGYVELVHGTQYSLLLHNSTPLRCDAEVTIDTEVVGIWRVNAGSQVRLEHPAQNPGRFTFYQLGTQEAQSANLQHSAETGLIQVIFRPELPTTLPFKPTILAAPCARQDHDHAVNTRSSKGYTAGGTGLSGESQQQFTTVAALNYDAAATHIIYLRLVAKATEVRPLKAYATPIPPPVD